jgi:alanine dehydrogenase
MAITDKPSYFAMSAHTLMPQEEMLETVRRKKTLLIGVPREMSAYEYRVPLSPQGVELLTANGHQVVIETNAGANASYSDTYFSEAGAQIAMDKKRCSSATSS